MTFAVCLQIRYNLQTQLKSLGYRQNKILDKCQIVPLLAQQTRNSKDPPDNSNCIPACHNDVSADASKQSPQLYSLSLSLTHTWPAGKRVREKRRHDSCSFFRAIKCGHLRRNEPVPAGCIRRDRPGWAKFVKITRSCRVFLETRGRKFACGTRARSISLGELVKMTRCDPV